MVLKRHRLSAVWPLCFVAANHSSRYIVYFFNCCAVVCSLFLQLGCVWYFFSLFWPFIALQQIKIRAVFRLEYLCKHLISYLITLDIRASYSRCSPPTCWFVLVYLTSSKRASRREGDRRTSWKGWKERDTARTKERNPDKENKAKRCDREK